MAHPSSSSLGKCLKSIKSLPVGIRLMEDSNHVFPDINLQQLKEEEEEEDLPIDDSPYAVVEHLTDLDPGPVNDDDNDNDNSNITTSSSSIAYSKWNDTASYAKYKNMHSWYQLPDGNWELANIISTAGSLIVISLPQGKVLKVQPHCLLPANPVILDGVPDLMQLSYLSEPSVLYNLHYRYDRDVIYTKAGPVLVALNPFKKLPLYGDESIQAYKSKSVATPHVYAIADTALREMTRDEVNQSIIIRWVGVNPTHLSERGPSCHIYVSSFPA